MKIKDKDNTHTVQAVAQSADDKHGLRPVLQQVCFTGSEVVATNGYLLAIGKCEIEKGMKPADAYRKMKKGQTIDAEGNICQEHGTLQIKDYKGSGEFPPYQNVITDDPADKTFRINIKHI